MGLTCLQPIVLCPFGVYIMFLSVCIPASVERFDKLVTSASCLINKNIYVLYFASFSSFMLCVSPCLSSSLNVDRPTGRDEC